MNEHFSWIEAEEGYGLANQGYTGDQQKPKPSPLDVVKYAMWLSWDRYRGMPKDEAQIKYIEWSEKIANRHGYSLEHPEKALIDKQYEQCVKKKLESGITMKQIEEDKAKFIENQIKEANRNQAKAEIYAKVTASQKGQDTPKDYSMHLALVNLLLILVCIC